MRCRACLCLEPGDEEVGLNIVKVPSAVMGCVGNHACRWVKPLLNDGHHPVKCSRNDGVRGIVRVDGRNLHLVDMHSALTSVCMLLSLKMQPASLSRLSVSRICKELNHGALLQDQLQPILPDPLFRLIIQEHKDNCILVVLGYYFYEGKKYCRECIRKRIPIVNSYQVIQTVGCIQQSNWQEIANDHRCFSCRTILYYTVGHVPVPECRCFGNTLVPRHYMAQGREV